MAGDRLYTVSPIDVDGAEFGVEGLQATLDAIRERWGGKQHKPTAVSPALTLGNGATIVAVESGRVMLIRDDAARALAKARAEQDADTDGRTKVFYARVTLGRGNTGAKSAVTEEVASSELSGDGLMGLLFNVAMFVQAELGDVPHCMGYEECERRERSIRAQVSRAKSQGRDSTGIHFPSSETGSFFEVEARPGEYYHAVVSVYTTAPQAHEPPTLPRRA